MQLLEEQADFVVFNVLKYTSTPQPSLLSSSASSGHILLQESSPDMSISPQSGRCLSWQTTPSPDPKLDLLRMQSSADSHTDDSPSLASSTSSQHEPDTHDKRTHKMFSSADSKPRRTSKSSYLSPSSPASPMSTSSVATPASPSPSPQEEEEDGIVRELNDIYKLYSNKPKKDHLGRGDNSKENGGTWPKCNGHEFNPKGAFPTVIHPGKKERPQLSDIFSSDHTDYKTYSTQTDSHGPPTPPERSDSFKKHASIKHSPQNSDTLGKYSQSARDTGTIGKVSAGYLTQMSHSHTEGKPSDKLPNYDKSNSLPGSYHSQMSNSSGPPSSSSSPASSYISGVSLPFPPDNTVVSAKADPQDMHSYLKSRKVNRPLSAPSRGRQERRELAAGLHGSRPPQKPTSLDIQPFSPRPLPHSSHNTVPFSQPLSPRDSTSSAGSSSGLGVTSTPASPAHASRYV